MKQSHPLIHRLCGYCAAVFVSLALLATPGCRTGKPEPTEEEKTAAAESAAKAKQAGEQAMDNILRGLEKSDYGLFAKNFTLDMREGFPEKGFASFVDNNFKKKYGDGYESRVYLGELSVGELTVLFWKARFKNYKNDVLLRLDIGEVDGDFKVFRFLIQ